MKKVKYLSYMLLLAVIWSCTDDTSSEVETIVPSTLQADFSFTNDGATFTFTNLSQEGVSYQWDFGDLNFYSHEKNPVYTYKVGGELTVSLTITDEAGNLGFVSKNVVAPEVLIIDVNIDDDFAEWEDLDFVFEKADTTTGTIQRMKFWDGGENLYFYLEGNESMNMELVQMFINTDNDVETGFAHWNWEGTSGAETYFEGPFVNESWGGFYLNTDRFDWAWDWVSDASNMTFSNVVPVDGVHAFEFSLNKAQFGELGDAIGFGIEELNIGWTSVGQFPDSTDDFIILELK